MRGKRSILRRRLNHRGKFRTPGKSFGSNRNGSGYLRLGRLHSLPQPGIDRDRTRFPHKAANARSDVIFYLYNILCYCLRLSPDKVLLNHHKSYWRDSRDTMAPRLCINRNLRPYS